MPLVLVVDDDQMNIEVMQAMLESHGVKSNCALNGQIALDLI